MNVGAREKVNIEQTAVLCSKTRGAFGLPNGETHFRGRGAFALPAKASGKEANSHIFPQGY